MKTENESFLRLKKKKEKGTLLDYVKSLEPDEEFAELLEEVLKERKLVTFKAARL